MPRRPAAVLSGLLAASLSCWLAACSGESPDAAATTEAAAGGGTAVPAANVVEVTFDVEGMHCDGCVDTISGEVGKLAHVHGCEVSLERNTATVRLDDPEAAAEVERAISALGFGVTRR